MVETTLNYLAQMAERPVYYLYEPPAGVPWRNTKGDRRRTVIHDARALEAEPSLDRDGFALVGFVSATDALFAEQSIKREYYPEVERLVQRITGAARVLAFDHNVRRGSLAARDEAGVQPPVRFAHNDYTERSGPQRVRDLLGDEADARLRRRFAVINVW